MAPQRQRPNLHLDLSNLTVPQFPVQQITQDPPEYHYDERPRDELGQTYYHACAEISSLEVDSPDVSSPNRGSYYVESNDRHVSWTAELAETVASPTQAPISQRSPIKIITKIMSPFRKGREPVTPQNIAPSPLVPERRYFTLKKRTRAKT